MKAPVSIPETDTPPRAWRGANVAAALSPPFRAAGARLRRSPKFAAALDRTQATWSRLVDAFCEAIEPLLTRYLPETRLVATVDPDGALALHRVTRDAAGRAIAIREASDGASVAGTKWTSVELRLPPEQVLRRTLTLPAASHDFIAPILDHRMDRLTPWKAENVVYGYRIVRAPDASNTLEIELVATSKDNVAGPLRRLAEFGITPMVIGEETGALTEPMDVTLGPQRASARHPRSHKLVSRIALVTLSALALMLVISAAGLSRANDAHEFTETRLVKARRMLRAASLNNLDGREKAMLDAKRPDRAVVVLVDRLATAIPPDTFLKELAITPEKVRLVGLSGNAPVLVGKLEAIGLGNVRFASGVTREKDGRDHFEIVAERRVVTPGPTP